MKIYDMTEERNTTFYVNEEGYLTIHQSHDGDEHEDGKELIFLSPRHFKVLYDMYEIIRKEQLENWVDFNEV